MARSAKRALRWTIVCLVVAACLPGPSTLALDRHKALTQFVLARRS